MRGFCGVWARVRRCEMLEQMGWKMDERKNVTITVSNRGRMGIVRYHTFRFFRSSGEKIVLDSGHYRRRDHILEHLTSAIFQSSEYWNKQIATTLVAFSVYMLSRSRSRLRGLSVLRNVSKVDKRLRNDNQQRLEHHFPSHPISHHHHHLKVQDSSQR